MKLTRIQKDLLTSLMALKIDTETIVLVMMACETDDKAKEMIQYLIELDDQKNPITTEILLSKIIELANN